ncbi:pentapeptide repeat-containing protein [Lutimonas sp.]|uniref:pentapeptide repeat-containing protein n=1 Tax=Lutimonas sp. TaxID=1872403 RepID=UPI003D9BE6C4
MRKLDRKNGIRFSNQTFSDANFDYVVYNDCVFHNCKFISITWNNCQFKNTYFLGGSVLDNCIFEDCKFIGQHTNLGGPTRYFQCKFINVNFKNNQFWDTIFENCIFTGTAENIVFYGPEAPEGWETKLINVDMTGLSLELVDFRCEIDLSTTKLKPAHNNGYNPSLS